MADVLVAVVVVVVFVVVVAVNNFTVFIASDTHLTYFIAIQSVIVLRFIMS